MFLHKLIYFFCLEVLLPRPPHQSVDWFLLLGVVVHQFPELEWHLVDFLDSGTYLFRLLIYLFQSMQNLFSFLKRIFIDHRLWAALFFHLESVIEHFFSNFSLDFIEFTRSPLMNFSALVEVIELGLHLLFSFIVLFFFDNLLMLFFFTQHRHFLCLRCSLLQIKMFIQRIIRLYKRIIILHLALLGVLQYGHLQRMLTFYRLGILDLVHQLLCVYHIIWFDFSFGSWRLVSFSFCVVALSLLVIHRILYSLLDWDVFIYLGADSVRRVSSEVLHHLLLVFECLLAWERHDVHGSELLLLLIDVCGTWELVAEPHALLKAKEVILFVVWVLFGSVI